MTQEKPAIKAQSADVAVATLSICNAEGGLFLNNDHMPAGQGRVRELVQALQKDWQATNLARPGAETWAAFWEAARAEPGFADLIAERQRRLAREGAGAWLPAEGSVRVRRV